MIRDIIKNRKLIAKLAKNDFKQKFAGSTLGIIWGFVQPVITVLVYWIVFEKALKQEGVVVGETNFPYVLLLSTGIIPWFYFAEVLSSGTIVLQEYNYLVKKVVFPINVLPVVKAVSSLFVHVFFVLFTVLLTLALGCGISPYVLQLIYYSFAMMIFVIALIYLTSALCVFFRDMAQLINIFLQVAIWATPIMWKFDLVLKEIELGHISPVIAYILKLNPMYYITSGYRDSFIYKVGFWSHPLLTGYFWIVTIIMFALGTHVFKKLQPQFADVI